MIGRRATHHRTVRRGPILDRPIPIDTHRLQVQSERRLERGVFTTLLDIRDHFNSFAPPASRILGTLPDQARADTRKPFTVVHRSADASDRESGASGGAAQCTFPHRARLREVSLHPVPGRRVQRGSFSGREREPRACGHTIIEHRWRQHGHRMTHGSLRRGTPYCFFGWPIISCADASREKCSSVRP